MMSLKCTKTKWFIERRSKFMNSRKFLKHSYHSRNDCFKSYKARNNSHIASRFFTKLDDCFINMRFLRLIFKKIVIMSTWWVSKSYRVAYVINAFQIIDLIIFKKKFIVIKIFYLFETLSYLASLVSNDVTLNIIFEIENSTIFDDFLFKLKNNSTSRIVAYLIIILILSRNKSLECVFMRYDLLSSLRYNILSIASHFANTNWESFDFTFIARIINVFFSTWISKILNQSIIFFCTISLWIFEFKCFNWDKCNRSSKRIWYRNCWLSVRVLRRNCCRNIESKLRRDLRRWLKIMWLKININCFKHVIFCVFKSRKWFKKLKLFDMKFFHCRKLKCCFWIFDTFKHEI